MSRHGLIRRLLAVGATAGGRAEAGRVRFVALLLATSMLALSLASVIATHATYEGQASRGEARAPVFQQDVPGSTARATWSVTGDSVPGSSLYRVVFLTRLSADAPLPPGVSSWPRPGEAVLSPALRDHPGAEDITTRYGRTVGLIGTEGLQSPDELFAYVVPHTAAKDDSVRPIIGYGPSAGPTFYTVGQSDDAKPEWTFLVLIALLLVLPAAVLLAVAARTGSYVRDRRTALVTVLGATPRDRALIVLGEVLRPVTAGTLLALAVAGVASTVDLRLPWTGHVLVASDLRGWWWAFLAVSLAAAAAVLAVVVLTDAIGRKNTGGTRIRGARRSPVKWAVACPILLLTAVRGPDLFPPGTTAFVMTNWVGAAGTLATLPAAIAVIIGVLGKKLAGLGRRYGRPGLLIAGRRAAVHPGPLARMIAGVVVAIGILLQAVAWQGQLGADALAAQATVERIGSSALVIEPRAATAGQLAAFRRSLPDDMAELSLTKDPEADRLTIRGRCPALQALELRCSREPSSLTGPPQDPRMRELIGWNSGVQGKVSVVQADPVTSLNDGRGFTQSVLVSRDATDLPVALIKQQAYRTFPLGAEVGTIGENWLAGAKVNQLQGNWLTLFGLAGITLLAAASAIAGLAEFLRNGRALAPVTTLTGNTRVYWSTAAHGILVPLTLAGLVGSVVGKWLAFPTTDSGASYISGGLLAACAAAATFVGVAGWVWGALVSVRQAAVWRPRGE
ncbi:MULTISPECIES: ABC transporter permease [Streptomyces]|uniref:Permease n=1 Tax=Streptomyces venezuelae TaxID=54571 RepID=A0A5P2B2A0_STRVZ|nr:ABC transporter permease [Streptomyces venezuelae]QES24722.1 permease [Streptomyces venezuelae]